MSSDGVLSFQEATRPQTISLGLEPSEKASFGLWRRNHQNLILFLQTGGKVKELGVLGVCFFQLGFQVCVLCFEECYYFGGGVIVSHLTIIDRFR